MFPYRSTGMGAQTLAPIPKKKPKDFVGKKIRNKQLTVHRQGQGSL